MTQSQYSQWWSCSSSWSFDGRKKVKESWFSGAQRWGRHAEMIPPCAEVMPSRNDLLNKCLRERWRIDSQILVKFCLSGACQNARVGENECAKNFVSQRGLWKFSRERKKKLVGNFLDGKYGKTLYTTFWKCCLWGKWGNACKTLYLSK